MNYKIKKSDDLIIFSEGKKIHAVTFSGAAKIRGCTHQAISELVRKGRLTVYFFCDRKFLDINQVRRYTAMPTGRPKKVKNQESQEE
jgi:hypothetical protein